MKRISIVILSFIVLASLTAMMEVKEDIASNDVSELLQAEMKKHNLSTIQTTERRGETYVFEKHIIYSFEENNFLKVDNGGFNLNHMYKYEIVLKPLKTKDSPYIELYF